VIIDVGAYGLPLVPGLPRIEWCDRCMTSSAVRLRVYVLSVDADPVFVLPVGLRYGCMACDPEMFGLVDDDDGPWGDAGAPAPVG
jgi:hypothetical protein